MKNSNIVLEAIKTAKKNIMECEAKRLDEFMNDESLIFSNILLESGIIELKDENTEVKDV